MTHPPSTSSETAHAEASAQRVVAVVVTYNREQLLSECLDALAAQERRPDAVVVIDNASTDASGRVADQHAVGADVVHLRRNVGGPVVSPPGSPVRWCAMRRTGCG